MRNQRSISRWILLVTVLLSIQAVAQHSQVAKLTESDGQQGNDIFGASVAMDGDTVVVGDPEAGGIYKLYQGAAYVFVKPAGGWQNMTQTAKLTASDGLGSDDFGNWVAVRGDTIVVGAYCHALLKSGKCAGAVYVFVKPPAGWTDMTETAELTASDDNSTTGFLLGKAVAIDGSGNTVFGGAPGAGLNGNGAIYVFTKPENGWANMTQDAELTTSDGAGLGVGGSTLSASGNTVASGAPAWPDSESNDCCLGAAYLWVKPVNGWTSTTETARLTSSDSQGSDLLGYAVSINKNLLVAGAPGVTINGNYQQGAAYVFMEPAGGWKTTSLFNAKLTAFNGQTKDGLGAAVAAEGGAIILGATGYNSFEGATDLYLKPTGGWKTTPNYNLRLTDPVGQTDAFFGASLALQGSVGVVGAYLERPTGAAYIYRAHR